MALDFIFSCQRVAQIHPKKMMFITPQQKGKKKKEPWRTHHYICIKSFSFFNLEKENATFENS
jgi:hypothetical protein